MCALFSTFDSPRRHAAVRLLRTIPKHIENDDKTRRPHTERLLRHHRLLGPNIEAEPS